MGAPQQAPLATISRLFSDGCSSSAEPGQEFGVEGHFQALLEGGQQQVVSSTLQPPVADQTSAVYDQLTGWGDAALGGLPQASAKSRLSQTVALCAGPLVQGREGRQAGP